ncbi:BlaI/MecI/CopY family transcriptional regulator [Actinokineospora sp.]|uniref:BlaI/MecI/CopY family transcriptional regulator n=1 Tax=Actinokineospora sp. TaxID=1872133 RepID=UPI0040379E1F
MYGLGGLESAIMDVLWAADEPVRVRTVLERLDTGKNLAYTTVMTVLDILHRKQWVEREMHDRAYYYRPAFSRAEVGARSLREIIDHSGDPEAVLLHFARSVTESESEALRRGLRKKPPRR